MADVWNQHPDRDRSLETVGGRLDPLNAGARTRLPVKGDQVLLCGIKWDVIFSDKAQGKIFLQRIREPGIIMP